MGANEPPAGVRRRPGIGRDPERALGRRASVCAAGGTGAEPGVRAFVNGNGSGRAERATTSRRRTCAARTTHATLGGALG